MPSHWYVSCAELSAEIHTRELVRALKRREPDARFQGMGGDLLRREDVRIDTDSATMRVMGMVEILGKIFPMRRTLIDCADRILMERPRGVILVDYPGFHARLAARLKKADPSIPVIQYISPKFWAWNYRRVRKMARVYDLVLSIFPFEKELLEAEGIKTVFVGNPLLDEMDLACDGSALRRDLGIAPDATLVGVFPGSRAGEIRRHMPIVTETVDLIRARIPGAVCALALAEGMTRADLERAAPLGVGAHIVENRSRELMAACNVALAKSGTTTLELALYGKPMAIFYQLSPITMALWHCVRRIRHVGLPNIIACDFGADPDDAIVPELIGRNATPRTCAEAVLDFLEHPARCAATGIRLRELRQVLGGPGASDRAADAILRHTTPA